MARVALHSLERERRGRHADRIEYPLLHLGQIVYIQIIVGTVGRPGRAETLNISRRA
jgi:hypothetical protein